MRGHAELDEAHARAIEQVYALIELAQGEDAGGRIAAAQVAAAGRSWPDVRLLLAFASALAAREAGEDETAHVLAMTDIATTLDDPALRALAWATLAHHRSLGDRTVASAASAETPLVQAVALLDEPGGPPVHRAAALIEVASVAHELGFWELAADHYRLTEDAVAAAADDPRWRPTARRQGRAVAFNRTDVALDAASAHALVGGWADAAALATDALRAGPDVVDAGWPPSWITEHDGQVRLLAALAGTDPPPARTHPPADAPAGAIATFDAAIRAFRAGAHATASDLAALVTDRLGGVPRNTHLLCLHIAARHPATPPLAVRYADELAALRWNNRRDRLNGIREAIAVERRRREHEHLRREIFVDELTGLANRRGYHAYVAAALDGEPDATATPGYAVMMIDVDRFKDVNDRFGHDIGDAVLSRLGDILAAHVRPVDLAARLGGDEFVVILAEVDADVLERRGRELVDAVRLHPWGDLADGLAVSVSVGGHHGARRELPAMLTDADRHLYQAKRHGRGRLAVQPG